MAIEERKAAAQELKAAEAKLANARAAMKKGDPPPMVKGYKMPKGVKPESPDDIGTAVNKWLAVEKSLKPTGKEPWERKPSRTSTALKTDMTTQLDLSTMKPIREPIAEPTPNRVKLPKAVSESVFPGIVIRPSVRQDQRTVPTTEEAARQRESTFTDTQTTPLTLTKPQVKPSGGTPTKTGTTTTTTIEGEKRGRGVARFRLPDGEDLPPDTYPSVVRWAQGTNDITYDLDTKRKTYTPRTSDFTKTPRETFRVIQTDTTEPEPQTFKMGIEIARVSGSRIDFERDYSVGKQERLNKAPKIRLFKGRRRF